MFIRVESIEIPDDSILFSEEWDFKREDKKNLCEIIRLSEKS